MIRLFLILNFYFILTSHVSGQNFLRKVKIVSESGIIVSTTKNSPFLLRSNQYGLVPLSSQIGYVSGTVKQEYDSLYTINKKLKPLGFGYAFTPHINFGNVNQVLMPEVFIKARYKAIEIYAGRRREIQGFVDTLGTMGSYIWSGNALPIPKVEISIPNYTPILGNGLISIKGNFAHGWFGKGDSVQNVLLHQKSLYVKIGKPNWKVKIISGFNHQVQWGGKPTKPFYDAISKQVISKFGTDFLTYLNAVSGVSLSKGGKDWGSQVGVAANEAGNRLGNHLGTVDIGLEWSSKYGRILVYRQSIYEDGSLYYLNNISDGLLGISFANARENSLFKNFTFEYLNTANQGGKYFFDQAPELRGLDNYFNNSIYRDNWTYKNQTIGNSLLVPLSNLDFKNSNSRNPNLIINNRVTAININVFYNIRALNVNTQVLSSRNYGSYGYIIDKNQFSVKQKIWYSYRDFQYNATLAGDFGEFWDNGIGINLSVKRAFR